MQQVVTPRIRVAKLACIAGLLLPGLVPTDVATPKERQGHIMPGLERAFTTLWSGYRPMRGPAWALSLFILTEIDAILATQR